jgi:protein TonB
MRKVETPPPSNPAFIPVYANLASRLSRTAARDIPGGTVDFDVALSSKELRVQASRPTGELSEGTMLVIQSNASAVGSNGASRSFWRFPEPPAMVLAAQEDRLSNLNPSASIKRLGDFSTIAGIKAEHVTFDVTLNPSGMPPSLRDQGINLQITGEAWLAPEYRSYAALQSRTYPTSPTGAPLLRQLDDIGFPMRLIIRGDMLGGYEVERTVTKIAEEPAAAFEVPADYVEIFVGRPDITKPQRLKEVPPVYPPQAMRAGIEGHVTLEVVVKSDGTIGDVRVLKSLDAQYGLDQAAVSAVRQWQFTPGLRGGTPVNVLVTVEIAFTLRRRPPPPAPAAPAAP